MQQKQQQEIPSDLDAERTVLGAMLLRPDPTVPLMASMLQAAQFHHVAHRQVFAAILALYAAKIPIDPVTVSSELERMSVLSKLDGGRSYLLRLLDDVPTAENAAAYAQIVVASAMVRRVIAFAQDLRAKAFGDYGSAEELIACARMELDEIAKGAGKSKARSISEAMASTMAELARARKRGFAGISTGFPDLDRLIGGFRPRELVQIAARPAMGKSALAMAFATHAARNGTPTLVCSLEMSEQQLMERLIAGDARVDLSELRRGAITDQAVWQAIQDAAPDVARNTRLWIAEMAGPTIEQVRAEAFKWAATHMSEKGNGLLVVDYVQLMSGTNKRDSREAQVSEVSRGLKSLANEMGLPVIALSQLNRELERRAPDDKRPKLSDLRESGSLEQDSDIVLFVYRDEIYNPRTDDKGIAEIIVGKQRNGDTGTARLGFRGKYTRFYPLDSRVALNGATPPEDYSARVSP